MPSPFSITTPAATVVLGDNRVGDVAFTVVDTSDRPLRARLRVMPLAPSPPEWFTITGDAERDFQPGTAHQFTVRVGPPLGAPPGQYPFRADAIGIEHPDDDYAEGPSCVVTVPPSVPPALTTPRGYLATLTGALTGGIAGELLVVIVVLTSSHKTAGCTGVGCVVGDSIGAVVALLFALIAGWILMLVGSAVGAGVALGIKRYRGAKLTATFLAVLMVPWTFLMLATVFQLAHSLVLVAVLAPVLLVAVPAVLARGAVLLIRTGHI
ncbi:MAG: hypothetical protein ACXVFN_00255 [Solirubrobacteraceae bacterium]